MVATEEDLNDGIAQLHEMARSDLTRYAAVACRIRTKEATQVPLVFNRAQRTTHAKIEKQKEEIGKVRCLVLKARQEGISTYVAARFWHQISLWPNLVALVVADHRKRSEVLWDIYQRYADNTPVLLSPEHKNALRRQEIILANGSQLGIDTAEDPDLGRAMTIHRLHASELAAWARAELSFQSAMSAVPSDSGEVIVESTAQGVGNTFSWLWEMSQDPRSEWLGIFLPWWIHEQYQRPCDRSLEEEIREQPDDFEAEALQDGIGYEGAQHKLTFDQLAWRRAVISDNFYGDQRMFRQEFPATAVEAFLVAGGGYFDADALIDYDKRIREPLARGLLVKRGNGIVFSKTDRGPLWIWEFPPKKKDQEDIVTGHYVLGSDTASGKQVSMRETEEGGSDFSVAYVGEPIKRKFVAELHGRLSPEAFGDQLDMLGRYYACRLEEDQRAAALIAVERNHSSGQTVLRRLRDKPTYPNVYMHRRLNARYDRPSNNYGWITDGTTRRPMLDGLAEALREGSLELPSAGLIREMRTFIIDGKDGEPEAQEGCHDDRVIAAAITLEMFRRHRHASSPRLVQDAIRELEARTPDTATRY